MTGSSERLVKAVSHGPVFSDKALTGTRGAVLRPSHDRKATASGGRHKEGAIRQWRLQTRSAEHLCRGVPQTLSVQPCPSRAAV